MELLFDPLSLLCGGFSSLLPILFWLFIIGIIVFGIVKALNASSGQVLEALGYTSQSYVVDAESNKFVPGEDKLRVWAKALGITWEEMQDLLLESKLEDLGVADPAFTMMFKEVPRMTIEEKRSLIRAYEAILKARAKKRVKK